MIGIEELVFMWYDNEMEQEYVEYIFTEGG